MDRPEAANSANRKTEDCTRGETGGKGGEGGAPDKSTKILLRKIGNIEKDHTNEPVWAIYCT